MFSNIAPMFSFKRLGLTALALACTATLGCSGRVVEINTTNVHYDSESATTAHGRSAQDIQHDRQAILGMVGEFEVHFAFDETMALQPGYELMEPYRSGAYEYVIVVTDEPTVIELQHLLVVEHEGQLHIIKHWRQLWQYEQTEMYHFLGRNVWEPKTISASAARGTWTQAVFHVSDEPRYWGTGTWSHVNGVSTWISDTTNRPLPRRETDRRNDYQVIVATNTHVVTANGWVHQQHNAKLDLDDADHPIIALEQGVNRYTRIDTVDFSTAQDYWDSTHVYWSNVRAVWSDLLAERETIHLSKTFRGDPMYNHLFDLSDEYWDDSDCEGAQAAIAQVIAGFTTEPASAE